MAIPVFSQIKTTDSVLSRIQANLQRSINPIVQLPQTQGVILSAVSLVSGANVIPHTLGRPLQGWYIVRMRGVFVQLYDTQDANPIPAVTLDLHSNGACVCDIAVF